MESNNKGENILQQLRSLNESNWKTLAEISEGLDDKDKAIFCYENAINNNPSKIHILNKLASIYQEEDKYEEAIKYLKRIIQANSSDFDAWSNLGHCYLMMEDLKKAQSSYQQAFSFPNSNNDPNLLYGIGILYARMNNLDYAQQLFEQVIKINETTNNKFEKINELCFRLGIVHKQKGNYDEAFKYFQMIGDNPPVPLSIDDIKFQKGHIYELQKNINKAKEIYDEILQNNPNNAKVHQQIGWLYYHNPQLCPQNNSIAIQHLTKAINIDSSDAQTWYLLGRCQMANKEYNKAYDAYQQAVERDGTNPAFWCSIGVLFFQINQFNDALNAYTKAIELDPNFSEVWYDLGTLYESCNQIDDSLGAYQKASELDPTNTHIRHRLNILKRKYENKDNSPNSMMMGQDNGMMMHQNNSSVGYMENGGVMNNAPLYGQDNNLIHQNNNSGVYMETHNQQYHDPSISNNLSIDKKRKILNDKEISPSHSYNHKKIKDDAPYTPKNDFSESTESSEQNDPQNQIYQNMPPNNYYNQNHNYHDQQNDPQNLPHYIPQKTYEPQYNQYSQNNNPYVDPSQQNDPNNPYGNVPPQSNNPDPHYDQSYNPNPPQHNDPQYPPQTNNEGPVEVYNSNSNLNIDPQKNNPLTNPSNNYNNLPPQNQSVVESHNVPLSQPIDTNNNNNPIAPVEIKLENPEIKSEPINNNSNNNNNNTTSEPPVDQNIQNNNVNNINNNINNNPPVNNPINSNNNINPETTHVQEPSNNPPPHVEIKVENPN